MVSMGFFLCCGCGVCVISVCVWVCVGMCLRLCYMCVNGGDVYVFSFVVSVFWL